MTEKKTKTTIHNNNNLAELPRMSYSHSKTAAGNVIENTSIEVVGYNLEDCEQGFKFIKKHMREK